MTDSPVDSEAMTGYQRVLLEGWPSAGNGPFERFAGAVDRAEAVEAGVVDDPVLLDLLGKLGTSCPDVDTAARLVSEAADEIGMRFRAPGGKFGETAAGDAVVRYFGPLREIAARMWRLDNGEWRVNPMYRAAAGPGR